MSLQTSVLNALLASLLVTTLACDDTSGTGGEGGAGSTSQASSSSSSASQSSSSGMMPVLKPIKLKLSRHGVPAVGVKVVFQDEQDLSELGSAAVTDASGAVSSPAIEEGISVVATIIDTPTSTLNHLYSMRGVKPGADLKFDLSPNESTTPVSVGKIQLQAPSGYPTATEYMFYTLGGKGASFVVDKNVAPGTSPGTQILDVPSTVSQTGNGVTLMMLAKKGDTVLAYVKMDGLNYAPTGMAPNLIAPTAWVPLGPSNDVLVEVAAPVSSLQLASTYLTHILPTQASFFTIATDPLSYGTDPIMQHASVIPAAAAEYVAWSSTLSATGGILRDRYRRTSALSTELHWNITGSALKDVSNLDHDAMAPGGPIAFSWMMTGVQTGADYGKIRVLWKTGANTSIWTMVAEPSSFGTGHVEFPVLPAAYAAYKPAAGSQYTYGDIEFGDYSTDSGYEDYLNNQNLGLDTYPVHYGDFERVLTSFN